MPPSSSSSDCDAAELDCAPSNEVKLNIVVALMFVCRLPEKHVDDSLTNYEMDGPLQRWFLMRASLFGHGGSSKHHVSYVLTYWNWHCNVDWSNTTNEGDFNKTAEKFGILIV